MSWIMTIFERFFSNKIVKETKRKYPTLKMVNPDLIVMDMKAFRNSKAVQAQAKAARESFENDQVKAKA
ncbi:hypothetical protein [Aliivibrio fischeri]|uniref:hypothetical protein n=1 Tax=Aliivibrio fischeri TaxID=668 RepID=UPI0007C4A2AE|nr:hypothetical protein [Aliivibrio fischeri]TDM54673.1 hypothetical protein VFFQA001_09000 [Aliivibrio fischeri]